MEHDLVCDIIIIISFFFLDSRSVCLNTDFRWFAALKWREEKKHTPKLFYYLEKEAGIKGNE